MGLSVSLCHTLRLLGGVGAYIKLFALHTLKTDLLPAIQYYFEKYMIWIKKKIIYVACPFSLLIGHIAAS